MPTSPPSPNLSFWKDLWRASGTGGLGWHWHAWVWRQHWQTTCDHIEQFLNSTRPPTSQLILIGPSAGWMLPQSWLTQFTHIEIYDIDPLAHVLFHWRHGRTLQRHHIQLHYHRQDAIATLPSILQTHPHASVWFDNVLGQLRYRIRNEIQTEHVLLQIKQHLRNHHWGSVHDWLSGAVRQSVALPPIVAPAQASQDPAWQQARLQQIQATGTWSDHQTNQVFAPHTVCHYVAWPYSDQYSHWLQMGWVTPVADVA